jgi:hypothetical protein
MHILPISCVVIHVGALFGIGTPPTTDPQTLRLLMEARRAELRQGFSVTYQVTDSDFGSDAERPRTLAWNNDGVRYQIGSAGDFVRHFGYASNTASLWEAGVVTESSDPEQVNLGTAVGDYELLLGVFPTHDVGGREPYLNDVISMLASPGVVVEEELQPLGGHECVVVRLQVGDPQVSNSVTLRGYYSPELGFTQVKFEVLRANGTAIFAWEASDFLQLEGGAPALPLAGYYKHWDELGNLTAWRLVEVTRNADGQPTVVSGAAVTTSLSIPEGAWVANLNTGTRGRYENEFLRADNGDDGGNVRVVPPGSTGVGTPFSAWPVVVLGLGALGVGLVGLRTRTSRVAPIRSHTS